TLTMGAVRITGKLTAAGTIGPAPRLPLRSSFPYRLSSGASNFRQISTERLFRSGRLRTNCAVGLRWESAENGQSARVPQNMGFSYRGEVGEPMEIGSRTVGVSCDDRTPISGPRAWGEE